MLLPGAPFCTGLPGLGAQAASGRSGRRGVPGKDAMHGSAGRGRATRAPCDPRRPGRPHIRRTAAGLRRRRRPCCRTRPTRTMTLTAPCSGCPTARAPPAAPPRPARRPRLRPCRARLRRVRMRSATHRAGSLGSQPCYASTVMQPCSYCAVSPHAAVLPSSNAELESDVTAMSSWHRCSCKIKRQSTKGTRRAPSRQRRLPHDGPRHVICLPGAGDHLVSAPAQQLLRHCKLGTVAQTKVATVLPRASP